MSERVSLLDFPGANGNGQVDNLNPLNAFLAAVAAGAKGYIPAGIYNFSAALDPVVGDNIEIEGDGPNSFLRYTGASTTADILTFGDGVNIRQGLSLRRFRIDSTTLMTAGQALRLKATLQVDLDLTIGIEYGVWRIYRGIWFDACTNMRLHSTGVFATNVGIVASAGVELHCMTALVKGLEVGGLGTGTGILIGGGFGGFYAENLTQILNDVGLNVNTSITGTGNTQIFLDSGTFDTNGTASVILNDAIPNAVGKVVRLNGWLASSNGPNGAGIIVAAWADGTIIGGNVTLKNHASSAIYVTDPTVRLVIGKSAELAFNGGFAVDSAMPITIECDAVPHSNALGSFAPNVTVVNTHNGTQKLVQNPIVGWMQDAVSSPTVTVANNANAPIAVGSGLILVANQTDGGTAIYLLGGNTAKLVEATLPTWSPPTNPPAPGTATVAYDNGAYRLFNRYGSSQAFVVVPLIKLRLST